MANEVKYNNQVWGEPIAGERLSTNGFYTGEHLGTPLQDALDVGGTQPYTTELQTVRLGTMTQDAIAGSMPTVIKE